MPPLQDYFYLPIVMNFGRYFLMAGIPFFIFYIWFPHKFSRQKIQDRIAQNKDFIREFLHSMKSIGVFIGVGILILSSPLGGYSRLYENLNDYPLWWIPLSILFALFIHDTYFYWLHRAMHDKKLFRWVHVIHHRSTNPTPLASYSFNLLEAVFENLAAFLVLLILPMHVLSLLVTVTFIFAFNVYAHLGYEILPRWFRHSILFECFITSVHHNMHHRRFKGNYGIYFRFWDRVMKTEFPDYTKVYDRIQEKRFEKDKPPAVKQPKAL